MIIYDLICDEGHRFEGWFKDLSDLEEQLENNVMSCPICDTKSISKIPSVFGQIKSKNKPPTLPSLKNFAEKPQHERIKELSTFIKNSFEDVGTNFAHEALKMHYGVKPKKNIFGHSSPEEEKTLKEEGVNFSKIPFVLPKDSN